jgi:hypothetical protein
LDETGLPSNLTTNVVYQEVFQRIWYSYLNEVKGNVQFFNFFVILVTYSGDYKWLFMFLLIK